MSSSEQQQRAAVSSDMPSGPGHQRQATKAAEDRLTDAAHKNIEKAVTDRRRTADMAMAEEWQIRGKGDQQATLPSGWDTAPASASSSEQQLAAARRQPAVEWQQPVLAASSSEQQRRAAASSSSER